MKIKTALILCAGLGKRLNPLTINTPKPLLKLRNITMLEHCINTILKLDIKKIFLNTFYLQEQIFEFIEKKNFPADIRIVTDGKEILNTGGGILNMVNQSSDSDFIIFNPDTYWNNNYINEINEMQNFYFSKKLDNLLLIVKNNLSFDENLKGDFDLKNNIISRKNKEYIFIGCQILNKRLFDKKYLSNFSISEIWNDFDDKNKLNGFESINKFYHLTDYEIFKKLKDL